MHNKNLSISIDLRQQQLKIASQLRLLLMMKSTMTRVKGENNCSTNQSQIWILCRRVYIVRC